MKRNTLVLGITLFVLAAFAWSGWANWEYRKQAAERRLATMAQLTPVQAAGTIPDSPLVGKPVPAFTLEDLHGKKVSLDQYKGKALLINFWATWCGPCKLETPWIVELRNQYAPHGFEVLGISTDDIDRDDKPRFAEEKQEIATFVQRMHMPYPVLIDGASLSHPFGGLDVMPMSFYVDRNGTVISAQAGITSKDEMEEKIKKALGK